ncbi:MAG: penicillin-binding protein 2 [Blastocatellia bacterium]|jgi:penicillin-binding protein 2|nr:penicillin-binding protein 2 [Blastocatellia bacterium]
MSRFSDEAQNFDARLSVVMYITLGFFLLLGVRFWVLQVVNHESYLVKSNENRIREIPIPAARGNILDRNGRILVDSRPAFNLIVNREDLKKQNLDDLLFVLRDNLGIDPDWARQQIEDPLAPKSRPVVVKQNISEADRAWIEAHEYEHPELNVALQPQRIYPLGPILGHVLGYVGQISDAQIKAILPEFEGARSGDVVGQAGIERSHNRTLMGKEGTRRVVVDSRGRFVEEIELVEPVPGQDIVTAIDIDLQMIAEEKLAATKLNGVAIALDPRNGEILALVSHPSYDPNLFAGGISPEDYAVLRDNPDKPLTNRAIQDIYPPGSTWKTVMAMAGLSEGSMKPNEGIPCGGGISIGSRFAACHGSHGAPNLERAIAVSCNGYFYRVGLRLGVDKLHKWATAMGLGKRTGVDLPNETPGYVPDAQIKLRWKKKDDDPADKKYRWNDGDTVNAAIGQGYDRPTPLQMVHAFGGIAMDGHFTTPHVLKTARSNGVEAERGFEDPNVVDIPLDPIAFKYVMEGMRQVVTSGTARRAEVPGFDVCGKTGTAQVVSIRTGATGKQKEHAWFVGFAPKPEEGRLPEIAVVVLVEHGGHGGTISAPIAQAIIAEYVRKTRGVVEGAAADAAAGDEAIVGVDSVDLEGSDEPAEADAADTSGDPAGVPAAPVPTIIPRVSTGGSSTPLPAEAQPPQQFSPLQGVMKDRPPAAPPPVPAGSRQ